MGVASSSMPAEMRAISMKCSATIMAFSGAPVSVSKSHYITTELAMN